MTIIHNAYFIGINVPIKNALTVYRSVFYCILYI